ncbi:DegV family protein [Acholeplasma granularum]|uniref:DegV family protein n=1 Tax=Acholeplasma granularum TaxID=264635 RepID=UPI000471F364|nr:DegV family protein [Acholeplasma granularum]
MKIGFTSDSSSGLAYAPFDHHAKITKTTIHFGSETLIDGVDILADEFYLRLEKDPSVPKTSAPTTQEILDRITELKNEGCTHVIHFPISTNLSTYGKNLEQIIKPLISDIEFKVIDTKAATLLQGYMVYFAQKLLENGYTYDQIEKEVLNLRNHTNAYFVVDDLKYLIKNGRLSNITGTIGILAKIKPILNLDKNGYITTKEKVRVHSKAIERMFEMIKDEAKDAKKVTYMVLHTNRLNDALEFKKKIETELSNVKQVLVSTITPTVGAHIGSKILGAGYVIEDEYAFL